MYTASPIEGNMVQSSGDYAGEPTTYANELNQIREGGHTPDGDHFQPPR